MHQESLKILFADDDVEDIDMLQEGLLEILPKHILQYVNHGEKIMSAAKAFGPDLIFLDYNMPGCNGAECLEKLKADDELKGIPVIMYSTSSMGSLLDESYKFGAARYLLKPVSYDGIFKGLRIIF